MDNGWKFLRGLIGCATWCALAAAGMTQEPRGQRSARSEERDAIVAAAPPELAGLIEVGAVQFVFYDSHDPPPERQRYPAETRFDVRYRYRSTNRWHVYQAAGRRRVAIRPAFEKITWQPSHTIHLPQRLVGPEFYAEPLVRHEFDHVRISVQPDFERRFREGIAELEVIDRTVPPGQTVDAAWVEQQVRSRVEDLFWQTLQLIEIRYRELDRLTDHGVQPLPAGFFAR